MPSPHTSLPKFAPCLNCRQVFAGNYCPVCGEKRFQAHDRSVLHFAEEAFHFLTHFEGSFFRTLKTMFRQPGQYSLDYSQGIRKKYFKPLSLFLLLVVMYLLFPLASGLVMNLKTYLKSDNLYGEVSHYLVKQYQARHPHVSLAQLSTDFHHKINGSAKFALLLLPPVTGLFLYAFFFRRKSFLYDHLLFATEWNTVFLIINFFLGPLFIITLMGAGKLFGLPPTMFNNDAVFSTLGLTVFGIWVSVALRRFYGFAWWLSGPMAVLLVYSFSILVYTFYKTFVVWLVFQTLH